MSITTRTCTRCRTVFRDGGQDACPHCSLPLPVAVPVAVAARVADVVIPAPSPAPPRPDVEIAPPSPLVRPDPPPPPPVVELVVEHVIEPVVEHVVEPPPPPPPIPEVPATPDAPPQVVIPQFSAPDRGRASELDLVGLPFAPHAESEPHSISFDRHDEARAAAALPPTSNGQHEGDVIHVTFEGPPVGPGFVHPPDQALRSVEEGPFPGFYPEPRPWFRRSAVFLLVVFVAVAAVAIALSL